MNPPASAPFWRRLAALFYDLLVLVALWMGAAAAVLAGFRGEVDVAHQPPLYHAVLQLTLLVISALYFAVSWSHGGQTIGMRAWRVRVTGTDGRSPTFARSLARFALATLSALGAGFGFLWCLFDADRRAWHDVVLKTRMIFQPAGD